MRQTYFLVVLFVLTSNLYGQQPKDTIVIDKAYASSRKVPLTVGKGSVILNHTNKLYLVNELRFNYYEELRLLVKDSIDKDIESVFLKYEKRLIENDLLFDQLELKCKSQSDLYQTTTDALRTSFTEVSKTLNLTKKSLDNANKSIDLGLEQISKSRKRQFWSNFGLIGGSIGVGLITGLILSN